MIHVFYVSQHRDVALIALGEHGDDLPELIAPTTALAVAATRAAVHAGRVGDIGGPGIHSSATFSVSVISGERRN